MRCVVSVTSPLALLKRKGRCWIRCGPVLGHISRGISLYLESSITVNWEITPASSCMALQYLFLPVSDLPRMCRVLWCWHYYQGHTAADSKMALEQMLFQNPWNRECVCVWLRWDPVKELEWQRASWGTSEAPKHISIVSLKTMQGWIPH